MTCREKLAIEHPDEINPGCSGGCTGCPSTYGYLQNPDYCDGGENYICTKCWDREIPSTESINQVSFETTSANTYHPNQLNLHKLIDEAMEKKDRSVHIFIMNDTVSVNIQPLSANDPRWIAYDTDNLRYDRVFVCSECRVYSDHPTPYCPHCGEKLRMPLEDEVIKKDVKDSSKESVEEANDDE